MKDCKEMCKLVRQERTDVSARKEKRRGEWEIVRPGETTVMRCKDYQSCFAGLVYTRIDNREYEFPPGIGGIENPCKVARMLQLSRAMKQLGR